MKLFCKQDMRSLWAMFAFSVLLAAVAAHPQTPAPDSISKVKRILLFNHNGGWDCSTCREKTQEVFFQMAQAKGFSVDTTTSVPFLTRENLERYQVIVWNNNFGGRQSVPDSNARLAVSDYVRRGGGWMLVNIANDHARTWTFLDSLIGPGTGGWRGSSVPALLVADSAARNDPELRYILGAMPDTIFLRTNWLTVNATDEDAHRIKTLYRLNNARWITQNPNPIPDRYIWAVTREKGRALSLPLGWPFASGGDIMSQSDSAVPKLYWQGLRWLAGDYQGGCTNPSMPGFDPEARVEDGSCPVTAVPARSQPAPIRIKIAGRSVRLLSPHAGARRIRLLDVRGRSVWRAALPASASGFALPEALLPGIHFLQISGSDSPFQARILIP